MTTDHAARRSASQRIATLRYTSLGCATPFTSNQGGTWGSPPRTATRHMASYCIASPLDASLRAAAPRNATPGHGGTTYADCRRYAALRSALLCPATQRPVMANGGSHRIATTHHGASRRSATPCTTTARNATRPTAAHRVSTQRYNHVGG